MNYLNEFYNYWYNLETIDLKPSEKFYDGKTYISILQNDGIDYVFQDKKYKIIGIKYISLDKKNDNINLSVIYGKHDLLNINSNRYIYNKVNINCHKDSYLTIINHNFKTDLSILLPSFYIQLTLQPINDKINDAQNNNLSLNTYIYDDVQLPKIMEYMIFNEKQEKNNVGICFSGGGPRSFCATLGYIRALKELKVLDKIKYVSCVSGSTWAWIPFLFMKSSWDQDKFIGLDIFGNLDKKLDLNMIKYSDKKYLGNSIISLASNTLLIEYIYQSFRHLGYYERSRIWPYMLGKIFLEPYDLMYTDFFTINQKILKLYYEKPLDIPNNIKFELPYNNDNNDYPFIITNCNVVKPDKRGSLTNTDFILVNMTPLYSGTLGTLVDKDGNYGNGYLNTYAFHPLNFFKKSFDKKKQNNIEFGQAEVSKKHDLNNINRFNLFDMMGSSSTAFGIITDLLGMSAINPSYRFVDKELDKVKYFDMIDGGVLDNAAILPMLQRKMKKIVLFINSNDPIKVDGTDLEMTKSIDIDIRQLFLGDVDVNKEWYFDYFEYINDLKVFDNEGGKRWKELLDQMRHNILENDIAFVELIGLKVLKNTNYQIEEYVLDKLLIVYLYKPVEWVNQRLDEDVKQVLMEKQFKKFPYYNTVMENSGWIEKEILELTASETNLLSDLTYWNLMKNNMINKSFIKLFDAI